MNLEQFEAQKLKFASYEYRSTAHKADVARAEAEAALRAEGKTEEEITAILG